MNYYEIAPLSKITNANGLLTYEYPEDIKIGTSVKIQIKNTEYIGIIISKITKPKYKTKEIIGIHSLGKVISDNNILLARYISENYFCSFGEALSAFFPFNLSIQKRREIDNENTATPIETKWPKLSDNQANIFNEIVESKDIKHLIFGVTGSGKTEIYLKLVENAIKNSKTSIILLPEISLTPQVIKQFLERFPNNVAVLHSGMKETERFKEWESIWLDEKRVVIGTRSAIFAPIKNLGVIIIDEFHENSYKQDQKPRYQTVTIAEELSKITGAKLILGSATPTVDKLFQSENGEYIKHSLNNRFIQNLMPNVTIVDMRNEYHLGNKSIFSEELQKNIKQSLVNKKQVLLFINRRGMSTFVSCRDCGYIANCPSCDIPLTFHYENMVLRCHHCDFTISPPVICPSCKSGAIKYFGTGTQRVEQELVKFIGSEYTIGRMDKDTTQKRGSHEKIFNDFSSGKTNILVGTQMVTKGWDLSNVGLVGIITADSLINLPDYNAHERALSLMIQVAGRTGRGDERGKVIVQTYVPDLPIFTYLKNHDFNGFYKQELLEREILGYPPFTKLVKLLYNNSSEEVTKKAVLVAATRINEFTTKNGIDAKIVGPSPAFIPRMRDKHRWQIIIKISDKRQAQDKLLRAFIQNNFEKDWSVDAEPNGVI